MVTLRRYFNAAEAAFAKTLLDNRGIFCSIADENSYLYGGAGFAMSIRILVAEEQFKEASRVLDQTAPAPDEEMISADVNQNIEVAALQESETQPPLESGGKNNPWEILVIALLFGGPGVMLLRQTHFALMTRGRYVTVLSPSNEHWCGAIAIAIGLVLVGLYFYTRHGIREDRDASKGRKSQDCGLHPTKI